MMKMMLFKRVLLLLVIARVKGLEGLWKFNDFSQNERTAKTLLEFCNSNDNLTETIVIFGDFNKLINKSSIVRLNNYAFRSPTDRDFAPIGAVSLKAGKILLSLESPETLQRDLWLLQRTRWWNHMAQFFIVAKNKRTCEDFRRILENTWMMNILNSVYICAESMDATGLYTLNPMANYAPYPWKRLENLNDLNVFHQVFDANASCENLNYDKTKILNAYQIKVAVRIFKDHVVEIGGKMYSPLPDPRGIEYRFLQLIISTLNTSVELRTIMFDEMFDVLVTGRSDIDVYSTTLSSYSGLPFFFPHKWSQMIAVVKLSPEQSTLQKILRMWSSPVLIAAGIALLVLSLILTMRNRSLILAMLDIVRLLTYTSIHTNAKNHWFRIHFTTMLIFMIISNGVFQGQIAAFLTKQERAGAVETIDELVKMKYHMYTSGTESFAMGKCSECTFKRVQPDDCINYVLNSTRHVCGMEKHGYEAHYPLLPLEIVKEMLNEEFENLKCRPDWPLQKRVNNVIMMIVESGIIDFWKMQDTYELIKKRQEMEAEWASAQYKPVRIYKLIFAFQVLGYGLGLATIVFVLEICWAKYRTR